MPIVFVPTPLRPLAGGQHEVRVDGANLRQVIDALEERYPGMRERLVDEEEPDRVMLGMAAFVDGETAHLGLRTPVQPDSEVHFLPAISGG